MWVVVSRWGWDGGELEYGCKGERLVEVGRRFESRVGRAGRTALELEGRGEEGAWGSGRERFGVDLAGERG